MQHVIVSPNRKRVLVSKKVGMFKRGKYSHVISSNGKRQKIINDEFENSPSYDPYDIKSNRTTILSTKLAGKCDMKPKKAVVENKNCNVTPQQPLNHPSSPPPLQSTLSDQRTTLNNSNTYLPPKKKRHNELIGFDYFTEAKQGLRHFSEENRRLELTKDNPWPASLMNTCLLIINRMSEGIQLAELQQMHNQSNFQIGESSLMELQKILHLVSRINEDSVTQRNTSREYSKEALKPVPFKCAGRPL